MESNTRTPINKSIESSCAFIYNEDTSIEQSTLKAKYDLSIVDSPLNGNRHHARGKMYSVSISVASAPYTEREHCLSIVDYFQNNDIAYAVNQ